MGISIEQWRAKVGTFVPQTKWKSKMQVWITGKDVLSLTLGLSLVLSLLLVVSGSVEENPGPGQGSESGQIEIIYDRVRDICGTVPDNQDVQCLEGTRIAQIMADSPDLLSGLSSFVSRRLCLSENTSKQKIFRSLTTTYEYISRALTSPEQGYDVLTGSNVEGSTTESSDEDVMLITTHVIATANTDKQDSYEHFCKLVMDMDDVRPGFSKLRLHNENIPDSVNLHNGIKKSLIHADNVSAYISSEKFLEYYVKFYKKKLANVDISFNQHGPCVKSRTIISPHKTNGQDTDYAFAIECSAWPDEAMEWVSRPRSKGWPSEDKVSGLKEMPCYLMAVGDPTSKHYNLEWRFAFVPTERELIWSFNDTQIHCLLLLKKLKNEYLESLAPDQLSSFHFKTIIFWMSEEHGLNMWRHENLIQCVHQCLKTLKNSIRSQELCHYIYRKRNLLYSKFLDQHQQTVVVHKISEIQENILHCILKMVCFPGESDTIIESVKRTKFLNGSIVTREFEDLQKAKIWEEQQMLLSFLLSRLTRTVNEKFTEIMQDIKKNKTSLKTSDQRKFLSYLSILMGSTILSEICETSDINRNKALLIQRARFYFEQGQLLDSTSGPLYLATFFYNRKEANRALEIIRKVCSNSNKQRSCYIGASTSCGPLLPSFGKTYGEILMSSNKVVAYDVIFRLQDEIFVPHAVKYEFASDYRFPVVWFHPLVYAYYLYFQICMDMNNEDGSTKAIQKLFKFLDLAPERPEVVYLTFNLLGFCFYKSGWYGAAIHCFRKSLYMYNETKNAAALHLWFTFQDMEKKKHK